MKIVKMSSFVCCLMVAGGLLLSACSTTSPVDKGAAEFNQKDYRAAFADLLPQAQKGNSQAQYAVGYLYYNGLGVDKDLQQAQVWFHKAADQGNAKAVKALDMISEAKASEPFPAPPGVLDAMNQ